MFTYKANVVKIVDGDTLDVSIDLGFKIFTVKRIRLQGINTPETYGVKKYSEEYKNGMLSKNFVIEFVNNCESVVEIHTRQERGKYGRYIATIFAPGSAKSLNDILVEKGYAVYVNY